jgi:hypothetical protein
MDRRPIAHHRGDWIDAERTGRHAVGHAPSARPRVTARQAAAGAYAGGSGWPG